MKIARLQRYAVAIPFTASVILFNVSLSTSAAYFPGGAIATYSSVILFTLASAFAVRSASGGGARLFLLFSYLALTALFTLLFGIDSQSLLALGGFANLILVYAIFASKRAAAASGAVFSSLLVLSILFAGVALSQLSNGDSYSYGKNQFSGHLANPNAFAGYCGLFLILHMTGLREAQKSISSRAVHLILLFIYLLLISLAGSRGVAMALLMTVVLSVRLNFRAIILIAVLTATITGVYFVAVSGIIKFDLSRSIYEETGRGRIISDYVDLLTQGNFPLGTGISRFNGRLRSELAYLDILVSSGIGAFLYFLFIFDRVRSAVRRARIGRDLLPSQVVIYVSTLSLVEGYLAGISSALTLLFFICCGDIYRSRTKHKVAARGGILPGTKLDKRGFKEEYSALT